MTAAYIQGARPLPYRPIFSSDEAARETSVRQSMRTMGQSIN
jgi:hypothetical protein